MIVVRWRDMDKSSKTQEKDSFRDGFVAGWMECVGDKEPNKRKLKQIAEAAVDNYIRNHGAASKSPDSRPD